MLTHSQIWKALDDLAETNGLSPSGLAKKAGLDPTTFNKSKRISPDGRQRWPSTESIAKALAATSTAIDNFIGLVSSAERRTGRWSVPLIGLAHAGQDGFFDDAGFPKGSGWDEIVFPALDDEHAYALEIAGDSMAPLYRDGDRIVVSPTSVPRRGDRVVLKTTSGEVMARELKRRTAKVVELSALNPKHPDRSFALTEIAWMARIVWASQ